MKHFFMDTNVVLDFLTDRKPFSISAAKLFGMAEKGKIRLHISAVSYNNIYYIAKKLSSHKEAIAILKDLDKLAETMNTTREIIKSALHSDLRDFEDAIQYYSAASEKKMDAIVTRDENGFKNSRLAVLSPDEALRVIENSN